MGYQPPLRSAVIFLLGLDAGAITAKTMSDLAEIPEDRSKAFLSILEKCRIVKTTKQGYVQGPKWGEWMRKPCRSRPSTANSFDFVVDAQKMKRAFAKRVRELMDEMGLNPYQLAQKAGIPTQYVYRMQDGSFPPVPQTIRIARALGKSVEELTA